MVLYGFMTFSGFAALTSFNFAGTPWFLTTGKNLAQQLLAVGSCLHSWVDRQSFFHNRLFRSKKWRPVAGNCIHPLPRLPLPSWCNTLRDVRFLEQPFGHQWSAQLQLVGFDDRILFFGRQLVTQNQKRRTIKRKTIMSAAQTHVPILSRHQQSLESPWYRINYNAVKRIDHVWTFTVNVNMNWKQTHHIAHLKYERHSNMRAWSLTITT